MGSVSPVQNVHALGAIPAWRHIGVAVMLLALLSGIPVTSAEEGGANGAVTPIVTLVDAGDFRAAEAAIARDLGQPALPVETRNALQFERERMRRILIDFPHTEADVHARLLEFIPDLREQEVAQWERENLLEHMVIDGRKRYFDRAVSNLFRLSEAATARRTTPPTWTDGPMEAPNAHHRAVREQAQVSGDSSVLPRRVRVRQSLTVDADAVPAGETVRAWIPFPRAIPGQQDDVVLIGSAPTPHVVAPESTLQRTVYMEKPAQSGQPTEFWIDYELTVHARDFAIDPAKVTPTRIAPAQITSLLAQHLGERPPHIVYTDAMRAFSRKVVGEETHPHRIAQKLFAAVDDIPWAGAREYSTLSNISDHALHAGHADCGQQTLLLMTLLRLNGIPARWQSGMVFSDGTYDNLHDWGWLYLAPYGWVPMDVTTGRFMDAQGSDGKSIEWFYLGGLDGYRIAFNDDFGTPLHPSKQHFRSETVDSQRGEAEWRGGNLYFDQWDYAFSAQVLPPRPD